MIALGATALALAFGVDFRRIILLVAAVYAPMLVLAGMIPILLILARRTDPTPSLFCEGVASELRAGSSVRQAIAVSAKAVGAEELAETALNGSLESTARRSATVFPRIGRELEITKSRATMTGAGAADLFDEIGSLALAQEEIRREVRVAAAPARAAAAIFVILPGGFILTRWVSGDLTGLVVTSGQRLMGSIGLALFLFGFVVAGLILWRSR